MSETLGSVLESIRSLVDIDTGDTTGIDLSVRTKYVNDSIEEWALAYDWAVLRETHVPSFQLSGTSFELPDRFSHLHSPIIDLAGTVGDREYDELNDPTDRFSFTSAELDTKKFCYVLGGALIINPPLASGASLQFDYQRFPASLTTTTDQIPMDSATFLKNRGKAMVLESRSDARFQKYNEDAERTLAQMIELEDAPSKGRENRIPDWMRRDNFRPGRD